jgi:hypothetical protein
MPKLPAQRNSLMEYIPYYKKNDSAVNVAKVVRKQKYDAPRSLDAEFFAGRAISDPSGICVIDPASLDTC